MKDFENLTMKDDESFNDSYGKVNDIVNASFTLGENMSDPKIIRKFRRSLPERF